MHTKFFHFLNQLKHNFWFIPSLTGIGSILLAFLLHYLDVTLANSLDWKLTDAAGARVIMTTVAGSSITVAGIIFSITMVVLSMSSAQYGPRLMRNFIGHSITKWVLGGYIGIFIYSLIIAATIRDEYNGGWVPQLSVTVGGVLGVVSFSFLIVFINHVASFMQASRLIDDATKRLEKTAKTLFPLSALKKCNRHLVGTGIMPDVSGAPKEIFTNNSGYVQAIGLDAILDFAVRKEALLFLHNKPGEFILSGERVASVWQCDDMEAATKVVLENLMLGIERTDDQDVEYTVDQLVEIAVRALSPGINDPFTAINCIKRLSEVVLEIARHGLPAGLIHDEQGKLRVATQTYSYEGLLDAAFHQIRQNAKSVEVVSLTLMDYFTRLAKLENDLSFRKTLAIHAKLLLLDCQNAGWNTGDISTLIAIYDEVFCQSEC